MRYLTIILSGVITIGFLSFMGCKTDDPPAPSPTELRLEELNNGSPWVLGSVIKNDQDVSAEFNNFSLVLSDFTYSTSNSLKTAWPPSGVWQFQDDNPNVMLRDDGTVIKMNIINGQLTLEFTIPEGELGGKSDGFSGEYIFSLISSN
uniref:hypothetical protein n=1 Tax=Fulvivirga sp. TaxID=1931237 RepID=UPI004049C919